MVTMSWQTEISGQPASTAELNQIDRATSTYFMDLLIDPSHSAIQEATTVLETSVNAASQQVQNNTIVLKSYINVTHTGYSGLTDLAGLLMFLTSRNTTNASFTTLDGLMGQGIHIDMLSFTNEESKLLSNLPNGPSALPKYSNTEKTLLITTSLLAFALFAMSIILLWVAGGWLALRKQVRVLMHREEERTRMSMAIAGQDLKEVPTADADEESGAKSPISEPATDFTNPSGILGVNPYYGQNGKMHGLGIKMSTPGRRSEFSDGDSDIGTPMSAASNYTESGAPLGITSMRKLLPTETDDGPNSVSQFTVKKLEY